MMQFFNITSEKQICFVLLQIFVEFASIDDSAAASQALGGRKFANRVVVTSYYSPEEYHKKIFY